ncbi:MAG: hypothetical protein B6D61_09055 [Bacteroidetes bacterium 4484_249]|nr:MAG: hypothetical protein B6D61_09055 [Bacteroidetes bacterium 4484_249]
MKKTVMIFVITFIILQYGIAQNIINNDVNCTSCYKTITSGSYSSALGYSTVSTGHYTLAGGYRSRAQGNRSFAFGTQDTAYMENSFAIGLQCAAKGDAAFAGGNQSKALGDYSFAFGDQSYTTKNSSIALGYQCLSKGVSSFATGYGSKALADYSTALGVWATAKGSRAVAIGFKSGANSTNAVAIGKNVKATNINSFIIGTGPLNDSMVNSIENSLKIGFGSTKHTFYVSTATATNKTGKIGIGDISSPQAKLHIKADNNEDASIKLEPTHSAHSAKILFDDDYSIYSKISNPLTFYSANSQSFFFENGKVGIGTATPEYLLDVAGSIHFTGQLYDSEGLFKTSKWEEDGDNIYYNSGNVGIGTSNPNTKLEVNGKVKATQLQITQNAGSDKILMSDANGNAMWMNMPAVDDGDWFTNSNGGIYHNNSWVGIGVSNPAARFELYGGDMLIGTSVKKFILHTTWSNGKFIIAPAIINNGTASGEWDKSFTLFEDGNVGIGFTDKDEALAKLTVKGNILAKEVKVKLNAGGGADFVFDNDYKLPDLKETEDFVLMNKHLPDIPSADEMVEQGIDLGDMQIKLLQKIEELTLYVIELKKENEVMKGEIQKLKED